MKFRSDINGLRAIAVVAVVLFHFFPNLLPGGFAGVDVFFIISGYLMTAIIFTGLEAKTFSLSKFYLSRANRIIPPLAVLCIALAVWGYYFLPIYDYRIVGRDILGAITFTSSIIFSLKQDYFEGKTNFLLHTWSLSTEWQFYIIYPIILVMLSRLVHLEKLKYVLIVCFILSLLTSIFGTQFYPTASYYMLPTRAWEMIIGGLAFLYPLNLSIKQSKITEVTGIAIIVAGYLFITEHTPWPGYMALLPVIGTYLVIISNREASFITANKVSQYLGKWSYSIYLWHWPIAVGFSYYYTNKNYLFVGVLASVVLGFLSYRYIESIRITTKKTPTKLFAYSVFVLAFSSVGFYIYQTNGLASKEDLTANSLIYGGMDDNYKNEEGVSLLNTDKEYDYILIGDSKAGHLVRGILRSEVPVKLSWYSDCLSLPHVYTYSNSYGSHWIESCKNNYKVAVDGKSDVIISQRWVRANSRNPLFCNNVSCALTGDYIKDLKLHLSALIDAIGSNRKIYILGELARPINGEIERCARTNQLLKLSVECRDKGKAVHGAKGINLVLKELASEYRGAYFIDPADAFCSQDKCRFSINNKSVYQPDLGHLTGYGSEVLWHFVLQQIYGNTSPRQDITISGTAH